MTNHAPQGEPIRVALVITELDIGGAERCLTHVASGLDRARFEPLVIAIGPRPVGEQQALVHRLEAVNVPVHFLNAPSKWQLLVAVRRLRKALDAFAPDVVQSFLFHADVLVRLASRGARWSSILGLRVADPSRRRQRLERWAARRATSVVCVSEAVRSYARDTIRIPAEKLVVIPNAIDVAAQRAVPPFDMTAVGVPRARRVILCVGRLHPQKGVDWLLGVLPAVFDRLPDYDLVVVGNGPEEQRLRAQARELGIADRVHFVGWRGDVPQFMAASSLVVLASRWEGMPNVVLEAMATGIPIVATDTHGVRELLGPDATTQTVEFGDSAALIDRLVTLGLDDSLARQIGATNQARATAEFSLDGMIGAYESLYESQLRPDDGRRA